MMGDLPGPVHGLAHLQDVALGFRPVHFLRGKQCDRDTGNMRARSGRG